MSADQFVGNWILVESENFNEYTKAVGFGYLQRKMAATVKPTMDIQIDDDGTWTIHLGTKFKSFTVKFKLGVEFEEETTDGRKVRSICTLENGKLIQKQTPINPNEKGSQVERYFDDKGRLVTNMEFGSVTAKRIYSKSS
ncbi:Protein CBR-LBP-5 [Aphelenchoides bicaudatus]|nr:Protein CBR-LBP-5 [Aphelenchoides bicaudatus]